MLDRLVTQVEPPPDPLARQASQAFRDVLSNHTIILLGDPGVGKTHLFQHAARHEGAAYTTVRQFVVFDGENCQGKTVYLDALDESRSRSDNKNTIQELVHIVRGFGRPKLRLSCRALDWLGNTDLQIFRQLAQDNSFLVLRLEALTEAQILTIAQSHYPGDAQHFYQEAIDRGLEALITNPQTLLMLLGVVAGGIWPRTRKELYERSAALLLKEPNEEHTRKPLGQFEASELFDAAGAANTSILISGMAGLSLRPNAPNAHYPSYRHVPLDDPQKVAAALCRRAFVTVADEQVTYSHRTVAEFLAAHWLAKRLQEGLPLGRIQSLLCVEGVPTPELRGLHAWLATLSPAQAPVLIAADPYGILVYGDAASMSPSLRKTLLQALQRLAQYDPWFRANDWTDKPLGSLSGPDMAELFRTVLADATSGFHLRSIVLDAIKNGPKLPELRNDLLAILADSNCPYTERKDAFIALLHVIPEDVHDVVSVFRDQLVGDRSTARLRAQILVKLYPDYLTTDDIVAVCDDILNDPKEHASGELWELTSAVPGRCLSEVISALSSLLVQHESFYDHRGNRIEIEWAFTQLLERFFTSHLPKHPGKIWSWLSALYRFRGRTAGGLSTDAIKAWLQKHPGLILSMFAIAVEQASIDELRRSYLYDFIGTIFRNIPYYELISHIANLLEKKKQYSDRDCEIYQFTLILCFQCDYEVIDLFERLYTLGNRDKALTEKRKVLCVSPIEEWNRQDALSKLKYAQEKQQRQERDQLNLYATAESIRTGQHLYNLSILAQKYFGLFVDSDRNIDPVTRLKNEIGDDLTELALEGFQAALLRSDLPSPVHIAELSSENRHYTWWYAILAGMDEKWRLARSLDGFPEAALEVALCLAFELSTFEYNGNTSRRTTREWPNRILTECPELARRIFRAFLRALFEKRISHSRMLDELVSNEKTQPWRGALALELLEEFSSAPSAALKNLLYATLSQVNCWTKLAGLAKHVLMTHGRARGEQRTLWMVTGYLLSPDDFRDMLVRYTRNREEALWTIKEFVESVTSSKQGDRIALAIAQRQLLVGLIGRRFGYADYPIGEIEGERHSWNAAEFVRWQIEALSAEPSEEAGQALVALASNKQLISYRDHLRHATANQAKIRRQHQYAQPDWDKTVETLRGGQPANIADLYALASDHLRTLGNEIRHSNIDIYKQFWELSPLGRVQRPQHEDVCRDRLIGLLMPRLSPLDISVEPEGHMAADKRADIVLYHGSELKLPIEVKRHTHKDLWTACEKQLDQLYARDPHAAGFGIYLVFWFGEDYGRRGPSPPQGMARPASATALEQALRSRLPADKTYCLNVIVLDVTPPAATKKAQTKSGRQK